MNRHAFAALQRSAGNAAVAAVVQRPAPAPAVSPRADPRFAAVESKVAGAAHRLRSHPAPAAEVRKAQAAAAPAAGERLAGAQAQQAATMGAAQPAAFDKPGFVAAVAAAIAAKAPANLDEADGFATSGKAEQVKQEVAGRAQAGARSSGAAIAGATAATPDPAAVPEKAVTPMPTEPVPAPPSIDMAGAVPARAPPAATDLSAGARETEGAMSAAGVTEETLASSNEPEFIGALDAKKKGEEHSATAPAQVRAAEAEQLGQATAGAQLAGGAGLASMLGARAGSNARATATKASTKSDDEAARAEVATHIQSIFTTTKAETQAILTTLDTTVAAKFDEGEKQAREAFRAEHTSAMTKYKDERYSGLSGAAAWVRDKFAGLPAEANAIFVTARGHYTQAMDRVISVVADHIGAELGRARERIATGRRQIDEYVASRPKALRAVATQAAQATAAGFEQLEGEIDSKKDGLVDDLAAKYTEARDAVDGEIKAAQDENTGLWDAAKAAIGGAIETIGKLKDMLLGVLSRAAGAVGRIVADPIGFLGKFVNAIKAGIVGFSTNIVEHLKKGLQGWLLGALAAGGIQLPEKFDLRGIIGLVLSILGLTWANIRARIVRKIPERVMGAVEKSVGFIQVLLTEGVPGLWKWVAAKVNDLKEMVMGQVREFVVTKIVKAGITWLIALLNPAAAFIKACKMIYDVVMFFVEKAAQIKEFVDAVLDSVESILGGGVGAVASLIENTLAKMLPVILSFLASLLGLGGISEKIQQILKTVQKPVMSVIDKLVAGAVKMGKKLLKGFGKVGAAVKGGVGRAKAAAGRVARKVGEKLGIIRKPVTLDGEAHRISVDARTGALTMASVEGPFEARITQMVAARTAALRRAGHSTSAIEAFAADVKAKARAARAQIEGAGPNRKPVAQAQLDLVAGMVAELWVRLGPAPTGSAANPAGVNPDLGVVRPHGSQPASHADPVPARRLESEHVIPVRVVSLLLQALGETQIIRRGSSEDRRQHTVMIYSSAASSKTRGVEGADYHLINNLKAIANIGRPMIEKDNITARRHKQAPAEVQAERLAAFEAKAAALRASLPSKLPALMTARVPWTMSKIRNDHQDPAVKQVRGHDAPLPGDDKVHQAAERQIQDIATIIAERIQAPTA
ncbi:MAG: hypothetical protein AAGC49_02570 [Brevundimonas sp.]